RQHQNTAACDLRVLEEPAELCGSCVHGRDGAVLQGRIQDVRQEREYFDEEDRRDRQLIPGARGTARAARKAGLQVALRSVPGGRLACPVIERYRRPIAEQALGLLEREEKSLYEEVETPTMPRRRDAEGPAPGFAHQGRDEEGSER